jgi:recombination protein RecA
MAKKPKKSIANYGEMSLDQIDDIVSSEDDADVLYAAEQAVVGRIPTGYTSVDVAFGGGVPRGRMTELFGPEGSCKTLLLMAAIATVQREGGEALLVDLEGTYDPIWGEINGIDNSRLRYVKPVNGDQAYSIIEKYLRSGKMDIIGVDSIAQLVPQAELEGVIGQANVGLASRLNAQAMRKLTSIMTTNSRTALVFINQTRANISTMGMGPTTTTTGGRAIPFYMTVRANLRRLEYVKRGEEVVGGFYQLELKKGKLTGLRTGAKATFQVDYDTGLDFAQDVLDQLVYGGQIIKSGAWYSLSTGEKIGQGEENVKAQMRRDLDRFRAMLAQDQTA